MYKTTDKNHVLLFGTYVSNFLLLYMKLIMIKINCHQVHKSVDYLKILVTTMTKNEA